MESVTGGSLRQLRARNRDRLLLLIRDQGPLHRAELARRAGLSRTTVSIIVTELLDAGKVIEVYPAADSPLSYDGRAGALLAVNPAVGTAVGIDFSYETVRVIVADLAHNVLSRKEADLRPDQSASANLALAVQLTEAALFQVDLDRSPLIGAGLGVPGPVDQTRREVGFSSNAASWVGAHAADELAGRLGVPVALDNTAHLGCLAESMWGAGVGYPSLIYLKLGFGVGGGFVIDGQIYRGVTGAAGELGHLTVDENGPSCRCGSRGCLEVYASVPAVLAALQPLFGRDVSLPVVLATARDGNRAVCRVLADTGQVLGNAMASVCNLLNPGRIIVGGDLAAAGDVLLDPLREALGRRALQIVANSVEVVPGELGQDAGALGGVALVLRELGRDR